MSKNKSTSSAKKGAKEMGKTSQNDATIYAIAFNLAVHAFADIPDANARIKAARYKLIKDQEVMTLSMKRTLDNAEAYALECIKLAKNDTKKYH